MIRRALYPFLTMMALYGMIACAHYDALILVLAMALAHFVLLMIALGSTERRRGR